MKTRIFDGSIPHKISIAQAVEVTHPKDFVFSHEEGRKLYAFVHVRKGGIGYTFSEDNQCITVWEGGTVYLPKGFKHTSRYLQDDTQVLVLEFDIEEPESSPLPDQCSVLPPEATNAFRGGRENFDRLDCYGCAASIYELLGLLARTEKALSPLFCRLMPAVEKIESDITSNYSVEYYAKLCMMSTSGFRRLFKKCFGTGPVEYRNNLRLMNAKKLIMGGECSVEQAAELSGFSNLSFFYRLFRRVYGNTPGKLLQ